MDAIHNKKLMYYSGDGSTYLVPLPLPLWIRSLNGSP